MTNISYCYMLSTEGNKVPSKEVKVNGVDVVLDWQDLRIASPSNLQDQLVSKKDTEKAIKKQKDIITPTSASTAF